MRQPEPFGGLVVLEPILHRDARGYFMESYNRQRLAATGMRSAFVQDNESFSKAGVLRGLHFQRGHQQAKLVRCSRGRILDVAVDLRPDSPNYKDHFAVELSETNRKQLYIPGGFAHGFCAHKDAWVLYKVTTHYSAPDELSLHYADPDLGIDWPIASPLVSDRDAAAPNLAGIADSLRAETDAQ